MVHQCSDSSTLFIGHTLSAWQHSAPLRSAMEEVSVPREQSLKAAIRGNKLPQAAGRGLLGYMPHDSRRRNEVWLAVVHLKRAYRRPMQPSVAAVEPAGVSRH
jgi:hypothetical protein